MGGYFMGKFLLFTSAPVYAGDAGYWLSKISFVRFAITLFLCFLNFSETNYY